MPTAGSLLHQAIEARELLAELAETAGGSFVSQVRKANAEDSPVLSEQHWSSSSPCPTCRIAQRSRFGSAQSHGN